MLEKLFDRILGIIGKRIGPRHFLELLVFLLCIGLTLYGFLHPFTLLQIQAVTIWVVLAVWYILVAYWKRIRGTRRIAMLVVAATVSAIWLFGMFYYRSRQVQEFTLKNSPPVRYDMSQAHPIILAIKMEGPALYRGTEIPFRLGITDSEIYTYDHKRWSRPPIDALQEMLEDTLRLSLKYRDVVLDDHNVKADYVLHAELIAFDEVDEPEQATRMKLGSKLFDANSGINVLDSIYQHDEPVSKETVEAVVDSFDKNAQKAITFATTGRKMSLQKRRWRSLRTNV
jgi:ABC-type uncharacterized transport system auxiliary subunit